VRPSAPQPSVRAGVTDGRGPGRSQLRLPQPLHPPGCEMMAATWAGVGAGAGWARAGAAAAVMAAAAASEMMSLRMGSSSGSAVCLVPGGSTVGCGAGRAPRMTARKTARRIARKKLQAVFSQLRAEEGSAARAGWVMARESPAGSWWRWRGNRCMRAHPGILGDGGGRQACVVLGEVQFRRVPGGCGGQVGRGRWGGGRAG